MDTNRQLARYELVERIDVLGRDLAHLTPMGVARAVDDIRREASVARFDALAALASGLEREMAHADGTMVAGPYLEAMSAAVDCEGGDPSAWLASVGVRLHG